MMELFCKKSYNRFAKIAFSRGELSQKASMVDVRQGSKYASVHIYKCSSIQTKAFDQTKTIFAAYSHGISKECV